MVEVHERQSRQLSDVASALSSLESASHGEERTFGLERLAARLAIRPGEYCQLLIGSDDVGDAGERARHGLLAGHVMENAYVHNVIHLTVNILFSHEWDCFSPTDGTDGEHESHELHEYLLNPCESVLSTGDLFGGKDIKTTETAALT